jgi:glycerophosphoryl diester phosphodiesterase
MRPLVIAHRGASWEEPENTLPAFERAIVLGADYVEFDVRAAPEGTLVCAHEPVRGRRTGGIPTLDEALEVLAGRVGIAVEIKEHAVTSRVLDALRTRGVDPTTVLVLSGHIATLETIRRLRPDLRLVLHLGRLRPDPSAATRYWGVGFADRSARPRVIAQAQSHGLATTVYTVNEPRRMLELARAGVTGIFTDRPDLLRRTLDEKLTA